MVRKNALFRSLLILLFFAGLISIIFSAFWQREKRHIAYPDFAGKVENDWKSSSPWWPKPVQSPKNAPNIIIIQVSDLGFSDLGTFGGEIKTPNLDKLAASGLRFVSYEVPPMSAPSRAALLTGSNPHSVGVGWSPKANLGYPGYQSEISIDAPTIAEILAEHGYATMMVGQWSQTYDYHAGPTGPFNSWPTQRGFHRFVGFIGSETHPFMPHRIIVGNNVDNTTSYPKNFFATDYWTLVAIQMIQDHVASDSEKPFFLYLAYNAVHPPLGAKPSDLEKYKGIYNDGWEKIRAARFKRQLDMGILPKYAKLPPLNPEVPNWDKLSNEDKQYFARLMEIYAAYVDNLDQNIGKLMTYLAKTNQLKNTIIIFTSDSGASAEGGPWGQSNSTVKFALVPRSHDFDLSRLNLLGGPQSWTAYSSGWANVSNTPFRFYKETAFAGGARVPMIVYWPGIKDKGAIRSQYVYQTDVSPTLLDILKISLSDNFKGNSIKPMTGVSFLDILKNPKAQSKHKEQYTETAGHRSLYQNGWRIAIFHKANAKFETEEWELYNLQKDPTESTNLANTLPNKVQQLSEVFNREAWKNQVYPLDDRSLAKTKVMPPHLIKEAKPKTFFYEGNTINPLDIDPLLADRNYKIIAKFNYEPGNQGVIYAHGDQGSGYILFVENGELAYEYNAYGTMIKLPRVKLSPGNHEIIYTVKALGQRKGHYEFTIDGQKVSEGDFFPTWSTSHEGLDIGIDRRAPVSWELYEKHGPFPYTGVIDSVRYEPGVFAPDSLFKPITNKNDSEVKKTS